MTMCNTFTPCSGGLANSCHMAALHSLTSAAWLRPDSSQQQLGTRCLPACATQHCPENWQPASPLQPGSVPAAAQLQLPRWPGAQVPAAGAASAPQGAPPAPARSSAAVGPGPGPAAVPVQQVCGARKRGAPLWHGSALPGPALHEPKTAQWQVGQSMTSTLWPFPGKAHCSGKHA